MKKFSVGDRVYLPENKSEGWVSEQGTVEAVEDGYPDMYIVRVDDALDEYDDRVREAHGGDMDALCPDCLEQGTFEFTPGPLTMPGDSPGYGRSEPGYGHFGPAHLHLIKAAVEVLRKARAYPSPFLPAELEEAIDNLRRAVNSYAPENSAIHCPMFGCRNIHPGGHDESDGPCVRCGEWTIDLDRAEAADGLVHESCMLDGESPA